MRANVAKQRLREGRPTIGVLLPFNSPAYVELCALAGLHFVMFDCEHGPMGVEALEQMVHAAEAVGVTPLARVPDGAPSTILRFLDVGVLGVLVPHVETAEQAAAAVQAAKYPPEGERSVGGTRAIDYGLRAPLAESIRQANAETMVMALVESRRGLENAAAISAVPGIDVVHIGPSDLSLSLGHVGQPDHPAVQAAIDEIVAAARAAGKAPGSGAIRGPAALRRALDRGIAFVTLSARDLIVDAGRQIMRDVGLE